MTVFRFFSSFAEGQIIILVHVVSSFEIYTCSKLNVLRGVPLIFRVRRGRENISSRCSSTRRHGAEVTPAILLEKKLQRSSIKGYVYPKPTQMGR